MSEGGYAHRPVAQATPSSTSSRAPAPKPKPAPQPAADPQGFAKLAGKKLRKSEAPRVIQLPPPIAQGLQSSWNRSLNPTAVEQGGNVVRNQDKSYTWRQGKPGTKEAFAPDSEDVGKGQTLIGAGHTHPYDDGTTATFSGDDLSSLVTGVERLEVLQSGKHVFVVARTAEFDALVDAAYDHDPQSGEAELMKRIEAAYTKVYSKATKATQAQYAELATIQVCREFKLVYYRGQGSTLGRVE